MSNPYEPDDGAPETGPAGTEVQYDVPPPAAAEAPVAPAYGGQGWPPPAPFQPPQPQFLGYGQDGQPVYGVPARPAFPGLLKTGLMVGAGVVATLIFQAMGNKGSKAD